MKKLPALFIGLVVVASIAGAGCDGSHPSKPRPAVTVVHEHHHHYYGPSHKAPKRTKSYKRR